MLCSPLQPMLYPLAATQCRSFYAVHFVNAISLFFERRIEN